PTDTASFEPMLRRAEAAAAFITAHRPAAAGPQPPGDPGGLASLIKLFLSDAGYLSEHNLTIPGPDRLIPPGKTPPRPRPPRRQPLGQPPDRRHGRPAGHRRRHHRLPPARPHRRNPPRPD